MASRRSRSGDLEGNNLGKSDYFVLSSEDIPIGASLLVTQSYQPTSESNHDVHRWLLGGGFALFLQGLLCRSRQVEKKKLKKITSYIPKQADHAIRTLLPQFLPPTVPYRGAVRK